jgi:hypothetical protein
MVYIAEKALPEFWFLGFCFVHLQHWRRKVSTVSISFPYEH